MTLNVEKVSSNRAFGGSLTKYKFVSTSLGDLETRFNVFLPEHTEKSFPILYYLAGLTCTEDTGPWKGGFLRDAAAHRLALIFPDTSPRGAGIKGEDDDWDFGTGAGFYLNATHETYSKHYNMSDFVTSELPAALRSLGLPLDFSRQSIFGHSMGGHGAISLYLRSFSSEKSPKYRSASAFSPVLNPTQSPWGKKAFEGYLKGGLQEGKEHDSSELIKHASEAGQTNILIDFGDEDQFYKDGQLLPENFTAAAQSVGKDVSIRKQAGYDHSYYFISTFGQEHIEYHAKFLNSS